MSPENGNAPGEGGAHSVAQPISKVTEPTRQPTTTQDWFTAALARGEAARRERVARIHRVDTKPCSGEQFGNDGDGDADVDTKCLSDQHFGNDALGFIRVRKRKLKGGHPRSKWRGTSACGAHRASTSASFDLVRAVRVDGNPRHEFLLGLGSQKDVELHGYHDLCRFWASAIHRMTRHELGEDQRRRLIVEMVRKGARLPTIETCEEHARLWPDHQAALGEIMLQLAEAAS